jgi:hypothetical protein
MRNGSLKARKAIAVLTLAMGALTTPVFADDASDCYASVMRTCDDTLADCSWWQKPIVGVFCVGMLAGCGFDAI